MWPQHTAWRMPDLVTGVRPAMGVDARKVPPRFDELLRLSEWSTAMSECAREFLEQWKSDHIESVTPGRRCQEAVRLVAMCREDATKAGIPAHELRSAAPDGYDLDYAGGLRCSLASEGQG